MELLTTNNVWMILVQHWYSSCTWVLPFRNRFDASENTINILFKNIFIITVGLLLYCLAGFNPMYPGDFNGFLGFAGFGLDAEAALDLTYSEGYTYWTDFLFQGMFAATAATIVSGAVAERNCLDHS